MKFRTKPIYKHDCKSCIFIGGGGKYDIYICPDTTVLARRSSAESDYHSGLEFVTDGTFFRDYKGDATDHELHWTNVAAAVLSQHVYMQLQHYGMSKSYDERADIKEDGPR